MNLAWISLGALVAVMIVSCFTTLNVGGLGWHSSGSSACISGA
jgi:hypothetical protein